MKPNWIALLCAPLLAAVSYCRQEDLSPAQKCRYITAADLADPKAPAFQTYPAKKEQINTIPRLDLTSNPIARTFRTVLRNQMAEGPNYAGHYRLAFWGCGSSCLMFAVVNLQNGKVITQEHIKSVDGVLLAADDFLSATESEVWAFRYKADSSLLVVLGAPDEDDSKKGAYYFVLKGETLRLIHATRVNKNCKNLPH